MPASGSPFSPPYQPNGSTADHGFIDSLTFYLEANGTGVLMDTTQPSGTTVPEALVGDLLPQTSTGDITGQLQGLALIGDNLSIAAAGEFSVAANGDINGLFDGSFPDVPPLLDSATSGTVFGRLRLHDCAGALG